MSNGTTTWTNTYNADGLRTKRTNGTTTYSYVYTGSSLLSMTVGSNTLYFNYDAAGIPLTVTYNNVVYYYATNLQGDVVAILDGSGNTVVSYTYDAWGNPTGTTGSLAATLGTVNPLRYRGYVYDPETGLYYLQSRYYNAEIGRFINADMLIATGQSLLSYDIFTYCVNNPAINADRTGMLHERTAGGWSKPVDADLPTGYILKQTAPSISNKPYGLANVAHSGCGAIATYNARITLGNPGGINSILRDFNNADSQILFGTLGTYPKAIAEYFENLGYYVYTTKDPQAIDSISQSASASILYYMYSYNKKVLGTTVPAVGHHYVEYHRTQDGMYEAVNAGTHKGTAKFKKPSQYAQDNSFYYFVIFIY